MSRSRRRTPLPKGNLRAVGNVVPGRYGATGPPARGMVVMGNGRGGLGYRLPVAASASVTAMDQQAGKRPGTGARGIPWHLPPEGPPYKVSG